MPHGFSHAIVLDFEATCSDTGAVRPQEIIELPSVLVAVPGGEVLDEFASFVRPVHHPQLTPFCRELTTIAQADVDAAPVFADVFAAHQAWLAGHGLTPQNALMVTCGDWDLRTMLPAQCRASEPPVSRIPPLFRRWANLKVLFAGVVGRKGAGMPKMLDALDLPLVGTHHRGVDDCRNLAAILRVLLARGLDLAPTGELAPDRHPPVPVRLQLGEASASVVLQKRTLASVRTAAGRSFRRPVASIAREDGTPVTSDADLTELQAGDVLVLG